MHRTLYMIKIMYSELGELCGRIEVYIYRLTESKIRVVSPFVKECVYHTTEPGIYALKYMPLIPSNNSAMTDTY